MVSKVSIKINGIGKQKTINSDACSLAPIALGQPASTVQENTMQHRIDASSCSHPSRQKGNGVYV